MPLTDNPEQLDTTLDDRGMQRDYLVLPEEELAKGFVRPVRHSYIHVGPPGPKYPLRDLTEAETAQYASVGYVRFEEYPESERPSLGRFWTQAQLDKIGKGCNAKTKMSDKLAETYARNPRFYGGTYCVGCQAHFPVGVNGELVWEDGSKVGT